MFWITPLGGAILGSSLKEGGGQIKPVSSAQITHDMVLRLGPLFMSSNVSEGWLPWVSPQLLPSQPAFTRHSSPGRHTAEYTHHPGRMNSDRHGRGDVRTRLRSLLKSNRFLRRGLLSRATFSAATLFPRQQVGPGSSAAWQSSSRPVQSAHSLFYQSLSCGK